MAESKEICSVDIGSSLKDNEYTLYENGKVKRYYDENMWRYNCIDWLEAKSLRDNIKEALLNECPDELKEKAKNLLYG